MQYAAYKYVNLLFQQVVKISMAEVGQAWQNGYIEQLIETIKEEEVDLSEYPNFTEAYQQIERFLDDVYMKKRIYSSFKYLTPDEYKKKWNEQKMEKHDIKKLLPYILQSSVRIQGCTSQHPMSTTEQSMSRL